MAPDFVTVDEKGDKLSLADFKGRKVILFAYPKALTPGCTAEACNLNDNYKLLTDKGFAIIGISADDAKKQTSFKAKYNFNYPLIPDTEKVILNDYGIWAEKSMYGKKYMGINRTTFVIDEGGRIEKIFEKVNTKSHADQILAEYK